MFIIDRNHTNINYSCGFPDAPTPFPEVYLLVTGHQELVLGDLAGYPFQLKLDAVVQDEPVCHLCLDHELEEESQWHQLKPKKLV